MYETENLLHGNAKNFNVDKSGKITYTLPGVANPVEAGVINISVFINPAGLTQAGSNLWVESAASGPPIEGQPGTQNFGTILGRSLEGSNVDPARELTELIRTQRAFEMNSQAIRAADETLQSVAQLRR